MLLYIMLYIVLAYLMLFTALTNAVCLNNASFFVIDLCKCFLFSCFVVVVVFVDPTPPTCCQQSPAPESCGSQQSLPPGGKERLHFVGIRPEVQARKGCW